VDTELRLSKLLQENNSPNSSAKRNVMRKRNQGQETSNMKMSSISPSFGECSVPIKDFAIESSSLLKHIPSID